MNSNCNCPYGPAVLALHLDGDLSAGELLGVADLLASDSLAAHWRSCPSCQRLLQRARRLDAAVAASAGRSLGSADAVSTRSAEWLATAAAAAAREAAATSSSGAAPSVASAQQFANRQFASRKWLAVLAVAASLGGICWLLLGGGGQTAGRSLPRGATSQLVAGASGVPDAAAVIAGSVEPSGGPAPTATSIASSAELLALPRFAAARPVLRAPSAAEQLLAVDADQIDRLVAARELLARVRDGSKAADGPLALARTFASRCDEQAGIWRLVLAAWRADAALAPRLLRMLPATAAGADLRAVLDLLVHLGDPTTEKTLLRLLSREPELLPPLLAAQRRLPQPPNLVPFSLELWSQAISRGTAAAAPEDARRFASGWPAPAYAELPALLADSNSVPRRVLCLLAMSQGPASLVREPLWRWTLTNTRDEGQAAALALAELPAAELAALLPSAAEPQAFLLRAALARAGVPAAAALVDAELAAALVAASPRQFVTLADRCRHLAAGPRF